MRDEADKMLAEYSILQTLGRYGDVRLFGSYELDLMVWPEIDIWVANPQFESQTCWDVIKDLSQVVSPTVVFVANQMDHVLNVNPLNAFLVDFRFKHRDIHWKLDIGISSGESQVDLFAMHDTVREKLTPASRSLIKTIKAKSVGSPRYLKSKWGFTSLDKNFSAYHIYLAVLRDGVSTPQEFAQYLLQTRGIDMRSEFNIVS